MTEDRGRKFLVGLLFSVLWFLSSAFCSPAVAEEASAYSQAVAAYQDRRLEEALSWAKAAVRQDPEHPDAYLLLGELYYLRQELTDAKEAWERALELAPSRQDVRERLEKLSREFKLERSLARSDTHPFVVRFARDSAPIDLGILRQMLRDTHRLVGQQLGYFPDHPITVILYAEEDFKQVKGISHQVAGLYDGKIRLPFRNGPGGISGTEELNRILRHEYTHALVHDLAKGRCPLWLNEGIATLQEARIHPPDLTEVKKGLDSGSLPSWDLLWQKQEYETQSLKVNYSQAYLITQYLVKRWGWTKMVGLLKRLGQGYPMRDALRAEFQEDPETIEKEWLRWLKRNL